MDWLDILKIEKLFRHIYKMVEEENIVNIDAIKQEIETDKLDNSNNNREEDE